jgi:hypothetical protein
LIRGPKDRNVTFVLNAHIPGRRKQINVLLGRIKRKEVIAIIA